MATEPESLKSSSSAGLGMSSGSGVRKPTVISKSVPRGPKSLMKSGPSPLMTVSANAKASRRNPYSIETATPLGGGPASFAIDTGHQSGFGGGVEVASPSAGGPAPFLMDTWHLRRGGGGVSPAGVGGVPQKKTDIPKQGGVESAPSPPMKQLPPFGQNEVASPSAGGPAPFLMDTWHLRRGRGGVSPAGVGGVPQKKTDIPKQGGVESAPSPPMKQLPPFGQNTELRRPAPKSRANKREASPPRTAPSPRQRTSRKATPSPDPGPDPARTADGLLEQTPANFTDIVPVSKQDAKLAAKHWNNTVHWNIGGKKIHNQALDMHDVIDKAIRSAADGSDASVDFGTAGPYKLQADVQDGKVKGVYLKLVHGRYKVPLEKPADDQPIPPKHVINAINRTMRRLAGDY